MTRADTSLRLHRLERALAGSRDGYWERDLATGEIWYSPSFHELFGLRPEQLPQTRGAASARVHPDDLQGFRASYDAALKALGHFDYEVRFLDGNDAWRWSRGRGQVWPGEDGRARYICGVVTDVHREKTALLALEQQRQHLAALVAERTARLESALAVAEQQRRVAQQQQREAEQQRQEAEHQRQEAERANAAKSVFLAQMSHEIRTPLNGVLGLSELALRVAQDASQRRFLEAALQSGRTLQQVISDVLDFSRIEAGSLALAPRPFDMPQTLATTVRSVMPLLHGRELVLLFDWEGEDEWVVGDERCIRQIVTNLVGNAAKFTERGHISLAGRSRRRPDGRLQVDLRIEDTGPGVTPEQAERIFEAFVQGDERLARAHGGTGLGLAIARRLARAMEGEVQLDRHHAGGAAMTVSLVLGAMSTATPAPRPPEPARGVWLVYPTVVAGHWMQRRFTRMGCQVAVLPGVDAAIAAAATTPTAPDLVLVSEPALLPGANLQALRTALPAANLHMVIRPDWFNPALEAQARALGIGQRVAPFTPRQMRELLGGRGLVLPVVAAPAPAPRKGATVLLVEDNPVNQLVGSEFLRALGLTVRVANDGAEALQACRDEPPALVLMDLQMPGMDGLEATRRLREMQRQGEWPGAPIVALTAHAGDSDRADCEANGMDAVMTKPFTLAGLQQELARWLP
ncbi:MAG: response regulator [Burkholderiales bacterium]|nr:response regulator [Burkholderiales bacterium]